MKTDPSALLRDAADTINTQAWLLHEARNLLDEASRWTEYPGHRNRLTNLVNRINTQIHGAPEPTTHQGASPDHPVRDKTSPGQWQEVAIVLQEQIAQAIRERNEARAYARHLEASIQNRAWEKDYVPSEDTHKLKQERDQARLALKDLKTKLRALGA